MKKVERLLYILALLRQRKNLGAVDLARRCGVSKRTILRDINSISSAHIPIFYDSGYRLLHEDFLPPMSFTSEEAGLLLEILHSYARFDPEENSPPLRSIIDKLEISATLKSGEVSGRPGMVYAEMN
jgi:predicted DNA-binding transcriptional regulator YafY